MRFRIRRKDAVGIEIAPLIDIVFILLIFFVVTSTFIRENALEIDLPESHSTVDVVRSSVIEIVISADNEIRVGKRAIPNATAEVLTVELTALVTELNSDHVVIKADAKAHHESVVLALDTANLLGLNNVSIVTVQTDG